MWDFKEFPAILKYAIPDPIEDAIEGHTVEVFGVLKMAMSETTLVVFRYNVTYPNLVSNHKDPNVSLLPFDEFYEKFKKFKLKENS